MPRALSDDPMAVLASVLPETPVSALARDPAAIAAEQEQERAAARARFAARYPHLTSAQRAMRPAFRRVSCAQDHATAATPAVAAVARPLLSAVMIATVR